MNPFEIPKEFRRNHFRTPEEFWREPMGSMGNPWGPVGNPWDPWVPHGAHQRICGAPWAPKWTPSGRVVFCFKARTSAVSCAKDSLRIDFIFKRIEHSLRFARKIGDMTRSHAPLHSPRLRRKICIQLTGLPSQTLTPCWRVPPVSAAGSAQPFQRSRSVRELLRIQLAGTR